MIPTHPAPLAQARPGLALLTFLLLTASAPAAEEATAWVKGPSSSARLVSSGGLEADRTYQSGVEIRLMGNTHTYWRTPGESGVPPVASFEGSRNLASAELLFPAPRRIVEAGAEVYGYRDSVIFPLKVVPADPAKPVDLVLDLRYAACDKICVPAEAQARLTLSPDAGRSSVADAIAEAQAKVPRPAGDEAPNLRLDRRSPKTWSVATDPQVAGADLFAEAPDGWFFETHARGGGFELVLAERPAEGREVPVTLTLTTPNGSWELSMKLDVTGTTP